MKNRAKWVFPCSVAGQGSLSSHWYIEGPLFLEGRWAYVLDMEDEGDVAKLRSSGGAPVQA